MSMITGLLVVVIALLVVLLFLRKRDKNRVQLLQERQQKEMDQFQSSLFTTLTRDLRTPLTVIPGATDELIRKTTDSPPELQLIQANTQRLLHLVNRLQDQSKLEAGQLRLDLEQSDIINHLQQLITSWRFQAKDQRISLEFQSVQPDFIMDFDRVRLIYIVSHLLNKTFRQTPQGGRIQLQVGVEQAKGHQESFLLRVLQTPILEKEQQNLHQDLGAEDAFISELVKLMKGDLQYSTVKAENTYLQTLILPVTRQAPPKELAMAQKAVIPRSSEGRTETIMEHEDAPLILIAEDNPDLVNLLSQILGYENNLLIARNGQQGIDLALSHVPDIIVTDVMMPQKDGYELCYTLKNHELTSHIPIIMMSAKTGINSRLTGLRQGADVYLEKPFQPEELEGLVAALLEQRRRLQTYYQSISGLSDEAISRPNEDLPDQQEDAFLQKVRQIVEDHLEQEDFSVEQLSQLLFMDASNLYRKVKALTGLSPVQYILSLRLQLAKKLLNESDESITSIALSCGFNSSGYFSRVFKKEMGMTPSAYRKKD